MLFTYELKFSSDVSNTLYLHFGVLVWPIIYVQGVEDGDSGNDEPADSFYNGFQRPVQDVPPGDQAAPSQDLARRLQLLSQMSAPRSPPFDNDSVHFQELPPEGMRQM